MTTEHRVYSLVARSPEVMKVIRDPFEWLDTTVALSKHVVSEEHTGEEERPKRAAGTVAVARAPLRDAISGISGLIEDKVATSVTLKGQSGLSATDRRLKTIF